MLVELRLENYVLFTRASLCFTSGLNVISGETGAGKSLLARAISLALGERSAADVLRVGTEEAAVTATFRLAAGEVPPELAASGAEAGDLALCRTIRRDGRGRLTVNGRQAAATAVRPAAGRLIDLAAQNEHTRLLESAYQRELLDRFGNCAAAAEKYAGHFRRAAALDERLRAGEAERERVRRRREVLARDLADLEELGYEAGKDAGLEDRIRALSQAGAIGELAAQGENRLYEGDAAVYDALAELSRQTGELADCLPELASAGRALEEAAAAVEEAARQYRAAAAACEADPGELETAIERAERLEKFARRFECEIAELGAVEEKLRAEAAELAGWETDAGDTAGELARELELAAAAGLELRRRRTAAAGKLAAAVDRELTGLGMPEAGFAAALREAWRPDEPREEILRRAGPGGLEEVDFLLSPNPGESASTLAQTASGGEASRAMLAIKAALAKVYCPPVLFFDEIDAGIGGRLGDEVGRKLLELSASRQVIAITHLPQIAALAHNHLKVAKRVRRGRTEAVVEELSGEGRVEEVAQMIRGAASTDLTRRQAEEMLRERETR